MIEVEKKFVLNDENEKRLIDGAEFLAVVTFTDTYYDTPDYRLSSRDIWLRERDGKYELKIALEQEGHRVNDQYEELEGEDAIKDRLGIISPLPLREVLPQHEYAAFCTCKTTRRKYKKEGVIIDLDKVEYDDFTYKLGEVEVVVPNAADGAEASKRIDAFAAAHDLALLPVRGKVIEYLKQKRPEHYQALVAAKVVQEH